MADDTPIAVNIPTLEYETGEWPGHLTGEFDQPKSDGTPGEMPSAPPDHPRFIVRPSDLRLAQAELLASVKPMIGEYMDLKAYVESTSDWIFQRSGPEDEMEILETNQGRGGRAQRVKADTAEGLEMAAVQADLMLACSDSIKLAGDFVNLIDKAGNMYVHADKESFLPDPS
jgi:hypothetical protein